MNTWSLETWKHKKALHQPVYNDLDELMKVEEQLKSFPPLVFAGEVETLKSRLSKVSEGSAFLLQGGDCAESFAEFSASNIRDTFKVFLQMTVILMYGAACPVVKIGRIAGQFAKPRSAEYEQVGDIKIPSYKGDIINSITADIDSREPDPERMIKAYYQSAVTMNLLRAFSTGGMASLEKVSKWNLDFVEQNLQNRYQDLASHVQEALNFMKTCGIESENTPSMAEAEFFVSHEALLLNYEEAFIRQDSFSNKFLDCSAHMLWIGDRTRFLDSAHVELLRGISNPIGIKVGPTTSTDELNKIIDILNPDNEAGKIVLISRMGKDKVGDFLPKIIQSIKNHDKKIVWSCDPMHGNTVKSNNGYKTRLFADICSELAQFFEIHQSEGTYPGGVHFEMTGQDVTECLGGTQGVKESNLSERYHTHCDPRMNADQALEVAFWLADHIKQHRLGK